MLLYMVQTQGNDILIQLEAGTPISVVDTGTPVKEGAVRDSARGSCMPVNTVVDDTETWVTLLLLLLEAGTPINAVDPLVVTADSASGDVSGKLAHCAATRSGVVLCGLVGKNFWAFVLEYP